MTTPIIELESRFATAWVVGRAYQTAIVDTPGDKHFPYREHALDTAEAVWSTSTALETGAIEKYFQP